MASTRFLSLHNALKSVMQENEDAILTFRGLTETGDLDVKKKDNRIEYCTMPFEQLLQIFNP